ncbi:MAG: M16 family metallopeptidase [Pyrinomonadaceae bacterium]
MIIVQSSKFKVQSSKPGLLNISVSLLLCGLILLLSVAGFAQTAATSLASQQALVTEFDVNGLKVLVKRRPNSPTVAAGLFFRGGSRNLTAENAGIENFTLDAATEGSKKYPREILRRELAKTASGVGSGSNYDFSVLSLASTRENFDRSWDVFTDIALNPAFAPEDVERVRDQIVTGLKNQTDDPDSYLQVLQNKVVYAGNPYANEPNGTVENVSKISAADLRAYHQKLMQTSRMLLVIVGDLDVADLQRRITASFGSLPRGDYKQQPTQALSFVAPTLDVTSRTLPTNYIQGVFLSPSLKDDDYYAMRVATTILRDKVFEEVRVKRNLSYAPNADMGSLSANSGNIYVTAVDANQAVSVMLREIESLKTEQVDEREISGVAGQFLTTYYIGQETNAAQAAELARYELTGNGWRESFQFLNKVKQVTPADVRRVSQKYMKNLRFVVLGNPASINQQIFLQK